MAELPPLETKVHQYWPDRVDEVLALLRRYTGNDAHRVRLGIVRLAQSSFERLSALLDLAHTDYRDILAGAESPRVMDATNLSGSRLSPAQKAERAELRRLDAEEYAAWLNGSGESQD